MVNVLAHLFGRQQRRAQSPKSLKSVLRNSTSEVVLRPLPENILKTLQIHHDSIVSIYSVYAKEFAQQHSKNLGVDEKLPISGRTASNNPTGVESGSLAAILEQNKIPVNSRSPFVALSGHGDVYQDISELVSTTRAGLVLTKHAVPSLLFLTSQDHALDAYAVDFYKHGQLEALVRDNGIRKADVWFYVSTRFNFLIRTLKLCNS